MPMKRYRKKTANKKRPRVKRYKKASTVTVRKYKIPVSDTLYIKLHYADQFNDNVSVALLLKQVRKYQSSAYEPVSGNPHQPLWYDQYCPNFYTNQRCLGISYDITVFSYLSNEIWWFVVRPQSNTTAETSLQTIMERQDSKWRVGGSNGSDKGSVRIKGYMSTAKVVGQKKSTIRTDDRYLASYNANPTIMSFLNLYISATVATTFAYTVNLTYYMEFSGRVSPGAS